MSTVNGAVIARDPHDGKGHTYLCRWILSLGRECCSCLGGEIGEVVRGKVTVIGGETVSASVEIKAGGKRERRR